MSIIAEKSFQFAVRTVNSYKFLSLEMKEFIMSKQLLRSGTSIGANVSEFGQSKADFISKLSIALKECNESMYWIRLLKETEYLNKNQFDSLYVDAVEIRKILIAIIKTSKS